MVQRPVETILFTAPKNPSSTRLPVRHPHRAVAPRVPVTPARTCETEEVDVHSPAIRSKNMAAIRSKGTSPEIYVRRALHAAGFRFRLHRKELPGKPDIVLPRFMTVVFVNGCFWHGHYCSDGHTPKTNSEYWGPKIARTMERDRRHRQELSEAGWSVITIHECHKNPETCALLGLLKAAATRRIRQPGEGTS